MTIDPKDLSTFYFGSGNEKSSEGEECKRGNHDEFYVNPSIAIHTATTVSSSNVSKMIVHGRGMVATKDITAGECIFITPPTVGLDMDIIKSKFKEITNTMTLEDLAMEELIDNMMKDIEARQDGENETTTLNRRINSFLCLMGSTKENEKEVTIEILNGKEDSELWSAEELKDLSRQGMKNIILKNGSSLNKQERMCRSQNIQLTEYFLFPSSLLCSIWSRFYHVRQDASPMVVVESFLYSTKHTGSLSIGSHDQSFVHSQCCSDLFQWIYHDGTCLSSHSGWPGNSLELHSTHASNGRSSEGTEKEAWLLVQM